MEHPRPPFPAPPRLRRLAPALLPTRRHPHHVPDQRRRPRAGHGLHYQEAEGVRLSRADDAVAHRHAAADQVLPRQEGVQQYLFLDLDDSWAVHCECCAVSCQIEQVG
jgi:hypothetical protein